VSRTRLIPVDPSAPDAAALAEAAGILLDGGLVAFPTETFYGLGANATDRRAVARVFEVKGRPESKPLLVLVDSVRMVESLALHVPDLARELMATHWPGPLTLVLRAAAGLPPELTAGTGTVGVRIPAHPVAVGLVRAAGFPVTGPSANPSGKEPPTSADGVRRFFEGMIEAILDGGPTAGGRPSTVLDVSAARPRLLREGALDLSALSLGLR
jgi:L-threonylcarbamoyladenylate synthase